MNSVGMIDLVTLAGHAVAALLLILGWRRALDSDTRLLFLGLLSLSLFHAFSNCLEWAGITAALDPFEDYVQLLEPALWFAVAYSFVQHRGRAELRESQEKLLDLYENAPAGYFSIGIDGSIRRCNLRAARFLGYSVEQLIGRPVMDLYADTPHGKVAAARLFERFRVGETIVDQELQMLRADGTAVWTSLTVNAVRDEDGEIVESRSMVVDVSERKEVDEAEARFRRISERAQQYLDVAGVMFVVLDRDGRVELVNRRGLEILGYGSASELLGKDWFATCVPDHIREEVRMIFLRLMSGAVEIAKRHENCVITRGGEIRIIAWHNTVLRDETGSIVGTLSSGEDITARRRAEDERRAMEVHLYQSQKLESIGTLASGVAHELNNPLTGVINYAQLIHDRVGNAKMKDYAAGIIEEGDRMAKIVRQLLSFARQDVQRHSPADLRDIVDETLTLIGAVLRKDQIRMEVDIPSDIPKIRCRSQQIQQVLLNLFTNARDALNDRYPEYHEDKVVRISVEAADDGRWLRTTVEDHGAGIPADVIGRVFDPFFTTKLRDRGTGIGLTISHGIVRDHGGRLVAESEPGAYTRFVMDLPVDAGEGK